jgi:hypothetical protein
MSSEMTLLEQDHYIVHVNTLHIENTKDCVLCFTVNGVFGTQRRPYLVIDHDDFTLFLLKY